MTDGYDCYQNALAEQVNGILKGELLLHRPTDLAQATKMVEQSVHIYNCERPHAAQKYKTPDAVHQAFWRVTTVNLFQDLTRIQRLLEAHDIVQTPLQHEEENFQKGNQDPHRP
jgi:hypothetical protein